MKAHTFRRFLTWIFGIAMVLAALFMGASLFLLHKVLDAPIHFQGLYQAADYGLEARTFKVTTEDGLQIAVYEVAPDTAQAVVLCLSGIQKPSVTAFMGHAQLFRSKGWATLMVEMRAHGESQGEEICLGYKEHLDVKAVLDWIDQSPEYKDLPVVVLGLSMGAATAINATALYPRINGLISLSAFSSAPETFQEILAANVGRPLAAVFRPFLGLALRFRFGSDMRINPAASMAALGGRPAIFLHTREDSNVAFANFERLQALAPDNTWFIPRPGDEHFITPHFLNPVNDADYAPILLSFIKHVCEN